MRMENLKTLKTYKSYLNIVNEGVKGRNDDNEFALSKAKEIVSNILKTKQYFLLLKDTTEHVYDMIIKQFPPNSDEFITYLDDNLPDLANIVSVLDNTLFQNDAINEIEEIIEILSEIESLNLDEYVDISGDIKDDEEFEEEDEDEEIEKDVEKAKQQIETEDQLIRKKKPTNEEKIFKIGEVVKISGTKGGISGRGVIGKVKTYDPKTNKYIVGVVGNVMPEDIEKLKKGDKVKLYTDEDKITGEIMTIKEDGTLIMKCDDGGSPLNVTPDQVFYIGESKELEKRLKDFIEKRGGIKEEPKKEEKGFKKGDIVYLNGIYTVVAKRLNGKRCEVVCKSEDKEDCYDLYDPTSPPAKDKANIKGMPAKYMSKEKPKVIIDTPPAKKSAKK